jgi:hypothetical protein
MGIQDNFTTLGNEAVAWGTKAATLTRGYETQDEAVTDRSTTYRSRGARPGRVGVPAERSLVVPRGASAVPIEIDALSKSMGLLLAPFGAGNASVATPMGATNARLITITPSTAGPSRSSTIHKGMYDISGSAHHVDYLGCIASTLDWTVNPGQNVKLKATFDAQTVDTSAASVTPVYPSDGFVFKDVDGVFSIDGGAGICLKTFQSTISTGMKFDRTRACPSGRARPVLASPVTPTGSFGQDFANMDEYGAFMDGTISSLEYTLTGPDIESGFPFFLKLTYPAIQRVSPSNPKTALDDEPDQTTTFEALDDATDGTWKIEYQTTDTAL